MSETTGFSASEYVTLFFELLQRSSDAVVLARAEDGVILEVNDAFLSLFRLSRTQVIGRTTIDLGLWVDPSSRAPAWERARAGRLDQARLRMRNVWSEEFTFELSAVTVPWRGQDAVLSVGRPVAAPRPAPPVRAPELVPDHGSSGG
jgi:PAS domain-containing protein